MKVAIVTGAAGFIGSHLLEALLELPAYDEIITIDAMTYAANVTWIRSLVSDRLTCVEDTILNFESALKEHLGQVGLMGDGLDIYHLAAESHVDRSIKGAADFISTNVLGTQRILEALRLYWPQAHLIHISTDEVYGPTEITHRALEDTPLKPKNPYSASKAAAEHFVAAYVNTYGLRATILRLCNQYGPRQHAEKLIPTLVRRAIQGASLPLYGNGMQVREWLYVKDGVRAILIAAALKHQGLEIFNIGSGLYRTNLEMAKAILDLIPGSDIAFIEDRPGHDFCYSVNCHKFMTLTGWKPQITLQEGLITTVETLKSSTPVGW